MDDDEREMQIHSNVQYTIHTGPATRLARASDSTLAGKCRPKRTGDDRHSAVTKSAEREYFTIYSQ